MKKIIIFSVGSAGRSIYRKIKNKYNIVGFIDNDKNLDGKKYEDANIYYIDKINNLDFDTIIIGGIWYSDMQEQLLSLGISIDKIEIFPEKDILYSTEMREVETDKAVKKLDEFLLSQKVSYRLGGSSLLNMLRGKSLSCATDVDIRISGYSNLEILKNNIIENFKEYNITVKYFKENTLISKKGDVRQIIISDNSDEKIAIDITPDFSYGDYFVGTYFDKFYYIPKDVVDKKIRYPYKDFYVCIPERYDEMLTLIYGKNYIIPPQKWSASDYKSVATKEELEKLVNKK